MNDIEILEHLEKMQKTFIEDGLQGYEMVIVNTKNLIENLIQRNKDLEQIEKEHKEENGRLRDRVKELESINAMQEYRINEMDIPRSKLKEKLENLKKDYKEALEENSTKAFILKCQIEILQELLEESEK